MFIIKKPSFVSNNKNLLIFNNALSEELINECVNYTKMCIENNIYTTTNMESWDDEIKGDSKVIKVIKLFKQNKTLNDKICKELKYNYNLLTNGLFLNIHIMSEGCYINEHTDGHVQYALTVYLNTLKEEDGGIFQYEDIDGDNLNKNMQKKIYREIVPETNKMILLKHSLHKVSNVLKNCRISLQGFYSDFYFYKGEPINLICNYSNKKYYIEF